MSANKYSPFQIWLPLVVAFSVVVGFLMGQQFSGSGAVPRMFGGHVQTNAEKFRDLLRNLEEYYVDTVDVSRLSDEAIREVLTRLDPHSSYIPASEVELYQNRLESGFAGIGIEFSMIADTLTVMSVNEEGPAYKAGIRPGDQLLEADGKPLSGQRFSNAEVVRMIRGEKGSAVLVKIFRLAADSVAEVPIVRGYISTFAVENALMADSLTGYIQLTRFSDNSAAEVANQLKALKEQGMKRLILDLRGNGGGLLDQAVKIADQFLPKNLLITFTDGRNDQFDTRYTSSSGGLFEEGPLAVLIDEYSASASEVLAGALQDHDRAVIIGRRSFGKGLVQRPVTFSDRSELRLTISRYYTPSGRSIQKPYGPSTQYDQELSERWKTGESYGRPDSLLLSRLEKFQTTAGRTVYGGGGILPDVLVGYDSSRLGTFFQECNRKDLIRLFALRHLPGAPHPPIEKWSQESFVSSFQITPAIWERFLHFTAAYGVQSSPPDAYTQAYISVLLRAHTARKQWKQEGFFRVFHPNDHAVSKALLLLSEPERYETFLH